MAAPDPALLGPLAALIGTWEGDDGLDVSFHNADGRIGETPLDGLIAHTDRNRLRRVG